VIKLICPECGLVRDISKSEARRRKSGLCKTCSIVRRNSTRIGKSSSLYKRGYSYSVAGYKVISVPMSHRFRIMAGKNNTCMEHRLIMAFHLDRPLLRTEIVHHKNGIKDDNRIENLELVDMHNHLVTIAYQKEIYELREKVQILEEKLSHYGGKNEI